MALDKPQKNWQSLSVDFGGIWPQFLMLIDLR